MIGREDEVREYRERVRLFQFLMLGMFCIIVGRLVYLQIMKGDELRKFSEANRLKKEKLLPTRGIIYDRNGKVIVDNRAAFDVVLLTQYYPFKERVNRRLAKALQMDYQELEKKLNKVSKAARYYPVLLKADVSKDIIAAIEMDAEGFPGVDIEATVQRRYPYGDVASQLLGYTSEVDTRDIKNDPAKALEPGDYIGKMGIERTYDQYLRGVNGVGYVEVDAMGRRKKTEGGERLLGFVAQTEPVAGNNLYLTIDADVEAAAAKSLKAQNLNGSVVAIDPRSGEVLALVNEPSYDPGMISGREINPKVWSELRTNKNRPLRNRAIQDHYPPGSTFKLFLAIAGLAEGAITPRSSVTCTGSIPFGNRRFNCWKKGGHGYVDFHRAIKESCDIFFYNLGHQLGVDTIAKYARLFGLGAPTGIKLSGEQRGLIPDSDWKLKTFKDIWHPGETLSVAIGQGFVDVTPIQLATGYAAISNGGFLYRPYLIRRIEGRSGDVIKEFQPELARKIEIPSEVFDRVKEGLYRVVNEQGGTAHAHRSKLTVMSGKTGTSQVRSFSDIHKLCELRDPKDRHHGWFAGYAPRENPQIAVAAIVEHGCHGSNAAKVVRDVIDAYMIKQAELTGVPLQVPDEKKGEKTTKLKVAREDVVVEEVTASVPKKPTAAGVGVGPGLGATPPKAPERVESGQPDANGAPEGEGE